MLSWHKELSCSLWNKKQLYLYIHLSCMKIILKLKFDFKNGKTNIRVYLTVSSYVYAICKISICNITSNCTTKCIELCMYDKKYKPEISWKNEKRTKNVYNFVKSQKCKYFLTNLNEILKMIDVSCIYSLFVLW